MDPPAYAGGTDLIITLGLIGNSALSYNLKLHFQGIWPQLRINERETKSHHEFR